MAQIGELFKTLGKNEIFNKYCSEIENGKTNNDIINIAFEDNDLMSLLRNIIDDDNIIKNKMDTIIGQKKKIFDTKIEKILKVDNSSTNLEEEDDYIFNFKPINDTNTTWIHKYCFIENIDHRMRLANYDFEIYY